MYHQTAKMQLIQTQLVFELCFTSFLGQLLSTTWCLRLVFNVDCVQILDDDISWTFAHSMHAMLTKECKNDVCSTVNKTDSDRQLVLLISIQTLQINVQR